MYACMYFDGGEGVVIIATPIHTAQAAVGPIVVRFPERTDPVSRNVSASKFVLTKNSFRFPF